jgi:hypothetical protein
MADVTTTRPPSCAIVSVKHEEAVDTCFLTRQKDFKLSFFKYHVSEPREAKQHFCCLPLLSKPKAPEKRILAGFARRHHCPNKQTTSQKPDLLGVRDHGCP